MKSDFGKWRGANSPQRIKELEMRLRQLERELDLLKNSPPLIIWAAEHEDESDRAPWRDGTC